MSIETFGVHRLRVFEESTFGADTSASVGSYLDVRHNSAELTLNREMLTDAHVVQRRLTENRDVVSRRSSELSLTSYLAPTGVALDELGSIGAITDPTIAGLQVLRACMGGYAANDGSLEAGASTASVVNVTAAEGGQFPQGRVFGCHIANSTNIEARMVRNRTTDALTPNVAFSGAPVGSSTVYNGHTLYFTDDPQKTLAFLLETADRDNVWWSMGHQGSFAIDLPLHQFPMLNYTLPGADYLHDDEAGTPFGASAFAESTYTDGDPTPFVQSEVLFTVGATGATPETRVTVCPSSISVALAFDVQPVTCPGGVNGILRWKHRRATPFITGEFTTFWDTTIGQDDTWWAARDSRTQYGLHVQIGNLPGGTALVALPNIQITNVQRADSEGLHGATVSFKALENNHNSPTNEIGRSPMTIGLL